MIRIRRLRRRALRRDRYEVELTHDGMVSNTVTATPVTLIDPQIGAAEAWSLVAAADEAAGDWVVWPPTQPSG